MERNTRVIRVALLKISAGFTQAKTPILSIKLVLYFSYLFADYEIEFDRFFDFFDRVDSRGVVFAPKFVGDAREAEVKLASE